MLLSPPTFDLFLFLVFFLSAFFLLFLFYGFLLLLPLSFCPSLYLLLSLSSASSSSSSVSGSTSFSVSSPFLCDSWLHGLSPPFPYSFATPRFVLFFPSWFLALFFPASLFSFFVFPSVQPLWFFTFFWGFLFCSLFSSPHPPFVVFYGFYQRLGSIRAFVPHDSIPVESVSGLETKWRRR